MATANNMAQIPTAMKRRLAFVNASMAIFGSKSGLLSTLFFSLFIIVILSHWYFFIVSHNQNWIGAIGADLTVLSIIRAFSNSLYPAFLEDSKPKTSYSMGSWYILPEDKSSLALNISEDVALGINSKHYAYICSRYLSIFTMQWLSVLGTLIWAYAFLIQ